MFNKIKKCKGSIKKIIVISFLCVIGIACYLVCAIQMSVKTEAKKIVVAIESRNIEMLEKVLFGMEDFTEDEEWTDFSINISNENDGVITKIIEQSFIDIKKITKDYIVYEIITPELSNIFKEIMKEENLTKDTIEKYMYEYIAKAERIKKEIKIFYSYEDGICKINYLTKEFMNGITGNLIIAYQELIQQMIQEKEGETLQ